MRHWCTRASASDALLNDPVTHAELVAYVLKGLLKRRSGAHPDVFATPLVEPAVVPQLVPGVGDGAGVLNGLLLPPPVLVHTANKHSVRAQTARVAADAKLACKTLAKLERGRHKPPPKPLTAAQQVKAAEIAAKAAERQAKAVAKAEAKAAGNYMSTRIV